MRRLLLVGGAALLLIAADAPPPAEITQAEATGVLGRMVRDADGREIGRIVDVVVDPSGQPRAIVIDAGGFMGVGARRVAVSWASVHVPPPAAEDKRVGIDLTDAQVRAAPDYTDREKPATIVGPPTGEAAPPQPAQIPAAQQSSAASSSETPESRQAETKAPGNAQ